MKNVKVYYIEILVIYQVLFAISLQGSRTEAEGFLLGLFPNLKQVIARTLPDIERSSQNNFNPQRPVSCNHGCLLPVCLPLSSVQVGWSLSL